MPDSSSACTVAPVDSTDPSGSYLTPSFEHARRRRDAPRGCDLRARNPLLAVAQRMASEHVHAIVVPPEAIEPDHREPDRRPWAVTDHDIPRSAASVADRTAGEVATGEVLLAQPDERLPDVAARMLAHGTSHAVVVEPRTGRPVRSCRRSTSPASSAGAEAEPGPRPFSLPRRPSCTSASVGRLPPRRRGAGRPAGAGSPGLGAGAWGSTGWDSLPDEGLPLPRSPMIAAVRAWVSLRRAASPHASCPYLPRSLSASRTLTFNVRIVAVIIAPPPPIGRAIDLDCNADDPTFLA